MLHQKTAANDEYIQSEKWQDHQLTYKNYQYISYIPKTNIEEEIGEMIPFTIASRKNLKINLTKEVKDLYNVNLKTLKK